MKYKRPHLNTLKRRLKEPRQFIQILTGSRQVGKTTLIKQLLPDLKNHHKYISADDYYSEPDSWLNQCWQSIRTQMKLKKITGGFVFIIDEIQKVPEWPSIIKQNWDSDSREAVNIKVVLLGSSPLLLQKGYKESLAGRYEIIPIPYWTYNEMNQAFGLSLEEFIFFGGFPGPVKLIKDYPRWKDYILGSIIEPIITKDILMLTRIDKPAILRQLFFLGAEYSGQIISITKLLGQLQGAGNTVTLTHYLELLTSAGMLTSIPKFSNSNVKKRASIPKMQVLNNSLYSALMNKSLKKTLTSPARWGRMVESAVGAHLINETWTSGIDVYYWREANKEIDFVLKYKNELIGLEVKSGTARRNVSGYTQFKKRYSPKSILKIGQDGLPLADFFKTPLKDLF